MHQPDWLLDSYDFDLPEALIAQHPPQRRDASRMLLLDRASGQLHHHSFPELLTLLPEGCTLVFNNTRVIPARLLGQRCTGARLEALLREEQAPTSGPRWSASPDASSWARNWRLARVGCSQSPGNTSTTASGCYNLKSGSR